MPRRPLEKPIFLSIVHVHKITDLLTKKFHESENKDWFSWTFILITVACISSFVASKVTIDLLISDSMHYWFSVALKVPLATRFLMQKSLCCLPGVFDFRRVKYWYEFGALPTVQIYFSWTIFLGVKKHIWDHSEKKKKTRSKYPVQDPLMHVAKRARLVLMQRIKARPDGRIF